LSEESITLKTQLTQQLQLNGNIRSSTQFKSRVNQSFMTLPGMSINNSVSLDLNNKDKLFPSMMLNSSKKDTQLRLNKEDLPCIPSPIKSRLDIKPQFVSSVETVWNRPKID